MKVSRVIFLFVGFAAFIGAIYLLPLGDSYKQTSSNRKLSDRFELGEEPTPVDISRAKSADEVDEDEELIHAEKTQKDVLEVPASKSLPPILKTSTPKATVNLQPQRQFQSDSNNLEGGEININAGQSQKDDTQDLLKELEHAGDSSGRIYGARSTNGLTGEVSPLADEAPADQLDILPLPRVGGQARGYTMLYLMNPNARKVVERQVEILVHSQINDIYIGVLIDGTFGRDVQYLKDVIQRISADGRRLTVVLYLSNGPTMRMFATTPITALFSRIDPRIFREQIRFDRQIRAQFINVVSDAKDVFQFLKARSPEHRGIAIVMLEDNLDRASYRAMRSLADQELSGLVSYIRNPCDCYPGSDSDTQGDGLEEHTVEGFNRLREGDGFSLDGTGFSYPGEPPSPKPNVPDLNSMLDQALVRKLQYFGLWRLNWQGILEGKPLAHPDERPYRASTAEEAKVEIDLLRRGLTPPTAPTATPIP